MTNGTSIVSVRNGSATPPPQRKRWRFTGRRRGRTNGTSMTMVTSAVTRAAPTDIKMPSRWIAAADGPAGSRVDCGPLHAAATRLAQSRSGRGSPRTGSLQRREKGRDVPRLFERQPDVRHSGVRHEGRRILQEGDERARVVR